MVPARLGPTVLGGVERVVWAFLCVRLDFIRDRMVPTMDVYGGPIFDHLSEIWDI